MTMTKNTSLKTCFAGSLLLIVSACTSVPDDGGFSRVQEIFVDQLGTEFDFPEPGLDEELSPDEVMALISGPLKISEAERISLQRNPMVRSMIAEVGIAEADYAQAGRMENPGFSYERLSGEEYTSTLLFDIGGLLLMPLRRDMELRRLEVAQYQAAGSILEHLANTRRAWLNAVAEKQQTQLMARTVESADTGNQLTRQMSSLGHSRVIEAAQSEIQLNELRTLLSKQRLSETAAKETLIRQLGLWGLEARSILLPDSLSPLPSAPLDIKSVEQQAIESRMDVQMARINIEGMAKNLSITKKNPFLSAIELGPVVESADGETATGYELELRIPIFDLGGVQNDKARFLLTQAQAQAEMVAISAASNARNAYRGYQNSWQVAYQYENEILPLRRRVSQEKLLMYNGMLISVFDLLDDVRSAAAVESDYVNTVRDFWLADTDLQQALTGSGEARMSFASASMLADAGSGGKEH